MTLPLSVGVVGLGLMGGSLARDLARLGVRVCAYDRDPARVREALDAGIVCRALDDTLAGLAACDMIVLAAPVGASAALLARVAAVRDQHATVTDVGSTKLDVVQAAIAAGGDEWFVGSHPLCGDHRSGWNASREGLFAGARVFISPAPHARPDAVARVEALWRGIGGVPERMDAAEHDHRLAWTSHLPHLLSSALARAFEERGITRDELGPGGRDMTRLAASCPELWSGVATHNAAAIEEALAAAEAEIGRWRQALRAGDELSIRARLGEARRWATP